jgi:hypothetical protein
MEGCFSPVGAPRNLKAKRSTDNSYVPMALTADVWQRGGRAATLSPDVFVERILFSRRGGSTAASGVAWSDASGRREVERARVVVLAAGAIESPRLWLNSRLPNPNGWVGRGLTNHFEDAVTGLMPFDTGLTRGPTSAARADFPGRGSIQAVGAPPADLALAFAFAKPGGSRTPARSSGRLVGRELVSFLFQVDRLLSVVALTDDDVDSRNRVSLSRRLPGACRA